MFSDDIVNGMTSPGMAIAMGLLGSSGYTTVPTSFGQGLASGLSQMQKAQQQRTDNLQKQQQLDLQNKLGQSQLAQNEFALQQNQKNAGLQDQRNQAIQNLIGAPSSMVNNFQGSGYLGSQQRPGQQPESLLGSGVSMGQNVDYSQQQPQTPMSPQDLYRNIGLLELQYGDPKDANAILTGGMNQYAPSNVEKVAAAMGLKPGTPDYQNTVRQLSQVGNYENQMKLAQERGNIQQDVKTNDTMRKEDAKIFDDQRQILQIAPVFHSQLDDIEKMVNSIPGWQLGATVGETSKKFAPQVQSFLSAANDATLTLKAIRGFPNNNFSDSDLKFLKELIGDPNTTKQAILQNIQRLKSQSKVSIDRAISMNSWWRDHGGDLKGFEDSQSKPSTLLDQGKGGGSNTSPSGNNGITDLHYGDL